MPMNGRDPGKRAKIKAERKSARDYKKVGKETGGLSKKAKKSVNKSTSAAVKTIRRGGTAADVKRARVTGNPMSK